MLQAPPLQVCMQSPPAHSIEHDADPLHVCTQSPPAQLSEHVDPIAHAYWQSPLPGHESVH
jgi:hypothetical protein